MDAEELIFNEFDEAEYYIKEDDDMDGMSLEESEDSDICADDCNTCLDQEDSAPKNVVDGAASSRLNQKDQLKVIYMKKFIKSVNEDLHEKTVIVTSTRDELITCQEKINQLEKERDQLYADTVKADEEGDIPNGDRMRAQHDRAILELEIEQGIEETIKDRLEQAEYDLAKSELEKGKYVLSEDDLKTQEIVVRDQKLADYAVRQAKEDNYLAKSYKAIDRSNQDARAAALDVERREKKAQADAMKAKEDVSKFLNKTMQEIRDHKKAETDRRSADLNRRISAVLSLKKNITINKDNINALRARNKDLHKQEQLADRSYMDEITAQGGDAETALLVKKRIEQMERSKRDHEVKQREAETQIAAKILLEEERFARRKDIYPHLWNEKQWEQKQRVKAHKRRKLKTLQADLTSSEDYQQYIAQLKAMPQHEAAPIRLSTTRGQNADSDEEEALTARIGRTQQQNTSSPSAPAGKGSEYAQPEFEGMWNKFEKYVVPKDVVVDVIKGSKVSRMDQDIMRDKLVAQRENIVQPQIAAGREFKGKSSFNSKPEVVHFKDFDVGKTYKKKVVLTNVSYSINFCKLTGLSDHLKDFVSVNFNPPGQLSAGMTCELLVTFKPMINEDLDGFINFLSQTGPFSLPIRCTTKKCDLHIDITEVHFGMSVIGETLRKHVTLTNNGALGTKLIFGKYTGKDHHIVTAKSPEFAQGEETPVSLENPDSPAPQSAADGAGLSPPQANSALPPDGSQYEPDEDDSRLISNGPQGSDSREESSVGASLSDAHDLDLDGMMVSEANSNYIKPFSQEKLEITWKPTVPGKCDAQFILSFEDEASPDITLTSGGTAIDVPVYVTRQNVDLQICMYDRLYQDSIVVKNRATSALKLTFEVPHEMKKHMELLPKTGFVQAQSSFSAQLKFMPRHTLYEEAPQFFDKETGVLEVPLVIHVADQTRPVPFVVHAIVTNSDLEFNTTSIDFGHCTIYESVKTTIQLSNHSILPQEFGFMGLPESIDIQPNDGFGLLLPEETIELDVIFSPSKAREYGFELCCKTLINREFKIQCKGVGVHPPLELSKQVVNFKATTLNDWSLHDIYVHNNHLSTNEYTHPVPRIGKGPIAPVGPTSFEFKVPEGAPITLFPSVGTVEPGKNHRIQMRFAPTLPVEKIKQEAVRVFVRKAEERALKEYEEKMKQEREEVEAQAVLASLGGANAAGNKKKPAAQTKPSGKASPKSKGTGRPLTGPEMDINGPEPVTAPTVSSIKMESDEYASAHSALLRQFEGDFQTFIIPCYIASGPCGKPGELKYSIHNTLYLEVHCPTVKPQVVVISNNGRTTTDYGDVSIGQEMNKTITIQNISDEDVDLTGSLLDTTGPFEMRNPLRELPPDVSHTLIIRFAPLRSDVFQETLHIINGSESTLHVNLLGRGVSPTIQLNLEEDVFDMGAVLVNEYAERTFKITNTSTLSVDYMIKFDSLNQLRSETMQALPAFVKPGSKQPHVIGPQNHNGKCVFDCVPYAGTISGGGAQDVTLTFAPDHESDYYSDGIHVELFNTEEAYSFQVIGQCKEHIMYVTGGQNLKPPVESLLPLVHVTPDDDTKPIAGHTLLMFYSIAKDGIFSTATADLIIGCVRTMAVSQKKNGEYAFENMNLINTKGFTISEPKAYLEAGTKKPVTISWTPPETHNPDEPIETSIMVSVKCDIAENYMVLLRGLIISKRPEDPDTMVVEDLEDNKSIPPSPLANPDNSPSQVKT